MWKIFYRILLSYNRTLFFYLICFLFDMLSWEIYYTIHIKKELLRKGFMTRPRIKEISSDTVKFNIRMGGGSTPSTSITLRKNILALWILMMEKYDSDYYQVTQEFIEKVCIQRWKRDDAKGFSDFVTKCMIKSILDNDDFEIYKRVYIKL